MLTPEEIRNITFTKGIGGYKTSEVDLFIDQCADTVEALLTEKAELGKKLEILADKLVEYRNDEDSIRTALLSAQRLGDTVVREANHKAGLIMDDANIKAQKIVENAQRSIVKEEEELVRIQREITSFKARMLSIYREHLSLIDVLPELNEAEEEAPAEEAAQAPAAVSDTPEETIPSPAAAAPAVQMAVPQEEPVFEPAVAPAAQEAATQEEPAAVPAFSRNIPQLDEDEVVMTAPSAAPVAQEEPKAASRFADLKFGEDYDIASDNEESRGLFRRGKK